MSDVWVVSFYRFLTITRPSLMVQEVKQKCLAAGAKGSILIASEGLNGSIAGSPEKMETLLAWFGSTFAGLMVHRTTALENPFYNLKVKQKREIINIGRVVDPTRLAGEYVAPKDWNDLISDPDVLVVDTRNDYEIAIGSFARAVNPDTRNFRDFSKWAEHALPKDKSQKIAMFCTGGIRCEKATAYLKQNGFSNVFHLHGGILSYLAEIPQNESLWQGECFVFDQRISVDHNLNPGSHDLCYGCGFPLSMTQKEHPNYREGICCHRCFERQSEIDLRSQASQQQQNFGVGQRHRKVK